MKLSGRCFLTNPLAHRISYAPIVCCRPWLQFLPFLKTVEEAQAWSASSHAWGKVTRTP
jgi:hypothetical protein